MKFKQTRYILHLIIAVFAIALGSCIEDGISTSPSDQPAFSCDSLKMGVVFTEEITTTHKFVVHNRHSKGMNISSITLSGENAQYFRLNVDGMSGRDFNNVEIRAKDSIFILVNATLPNAGIDLPLDINANIDFVTNGVTSTVVVNAQGQDVNRLTAVTIDSDTRFDSAKPYQVFDSLVVAAGARLTLAPGTRLYFHDGSRLIVRGTLDSQGTSESPVNICGDRTGNVVTDITFDLMSRQWQGVYFTPSSRDNVLSHTSLRNTVYGVTVYGDEDGTPDLTIVNSQLRNSGDLVLDAVNARINAYGSEFAEAASGLVRLVGGEHVFNHCTFANYYLFSAISGPALTFEYLFPDEMGESTLPLMKAEFANSIVYGLGSEFSHGDLTDSQVYFRNCLFKSSGSDDDNFVGCLWGSDPLYYTVREDYLFDYRLKDGSPAIAAGNGELTAPQAAVDFYGLQRGTTPDLGAYVYTPSVQ